jgi:stage V sporulation protein B
MAQSKVTNPPAPKVVDDAQSAGRGTIYITLAKLWFIASGYGIEFTLPRLLAKEDFGLYKVVVGAVSILNAVIVTGTQQTVSKYISQDETRADSVKSTALKLQLLVGGIAALGFFLLAPLIASYLNDARLTNHLRIASLITLSYAFYAVFIGYFNGQKKFFAQAALDSSYSTFKLIFVVLFVALGLGVAGGISGFALAAASVLAVSAIAAGKGSRYGEVHGSDLFKFQSYLLLFTLVLNLLQKVDLMLVKALSSTDATLASKNAADYGAAINIANITYQIIISVTFVIFPLISQATFANDREKTQRFIANTLRYSMMIMVLTATLFSANAQQVLGLLYPSEYQFGAAALQVVAYGMLFFGLLYVLTTIISASGRPKVSLAIGLLALGVSALLNFTLIPRYGLSGAGWATTLAMLTGVCAGASYLISRFKSLLAIGSVLRIAGCGAVIYFLSLVYIPEQKIMLMVKLSLLSLLYFVALIICREIGREDLAAVKRVIKQ